MFIFTKPNSGSISSQRKALHLAKDIKRKVVVSDIKDLHFSTRVKEVEIVAVEIFTRLTGRSI